MKKVINGMSCDLCGTVFTNIEFPIEIRDHKFNVRVMCAIEIVDGELKHSIQDWEIIDLTIRGTTIADWKSIKEYLDNLQNITLTVGLINSSLVHPDYTELLDKQITEFIDGCKPEQLMSDLLSFVGKKQKTIKKKK